VKGTYRGPWDLMASTSIKWWSGFRYARTVNTDVWVST
jgi:hypothetical protein